MCTFQANSSDYIYRLLLIVWKEVLGTELCLHIVDKIHTLEIISSESGTLNDLIYFMRN